MKAIVFENKESVTRFKISGPKVSKAGISTENVELHDSGYVWLEQIDESGETRKFHDVINIDGYRFGIDIEIENGNLILRVFTDRPHIATCYSESCAINLPMGKQ